MIVQVVHIFEKDVAVHQNASFMKKGNRVKIMKKKIINLICLSLVACMFLCACGTNKDKTTEINSKLVGKTFSGTCEGTYSKWGIEITFVSKTQCDISHKWENEPAYKEQSHKNVSYDLNGGINGVTVVWDEDICVYEGAEPFKVLEYNDSMELYTENYDSEIPMRLTEQ